MFGKVPYPRLLLRIGSLAPLRMNTRTGINFGVLGFPASEQQVPASPCTEEENKEVSVLGAFNVTPSLLVRGVIGEAGRLGAVLDSTQDPSLAGWTHGSFVRALRICDFRAQPHPKCPIQAYFATGPAVHWPNFSRLSDRTE